MRGGGIRSRRNENKARRDLAERMNYRTGIHESIQEIKDDQ